MDCWNKKRDLFKMNTFTVACLIMVTSITSCNILGGGDDDPPLEPGPRNYTWQVDTIYTDPGGFIDNIWGTSPTDVWAVLGNGVETLWHFDGKDWEPWLERVGPALYSIDGSDKENVWIGGNDGKIFNFNGSAWSLTFTYSPDSLKNPDIVDIQVVSNSDIYAIGYAIPEGASSWVSFVLHFDGKNWKEVFVSDFKVLFTRLLMDGVKPIIRGVKRAEDGDDELLIYKYEKNELREIISGTRSVVRSISMNKIKKDIYSYTGTTISKLKDNKFEVFLNFPNVEEIVRIDGRHEKDLFIHSWDKTFHYNGENLQLMLEDLPRNVFRAALYEKEVFFTIRDYTNGTNLIYHGTLTD